MHYNTVCLRKFNLGTKETDMTSDCSILENSCLKGLYRRIVFSAPEIAAKAEPGQFVHIRIPTLRDRVLRRPFSICGYDPQAGTLTVVYKVVGAGTSELAETLPGRVCDVMGPLGKGYPMPSADETPILVAGGYGSAAILPLAERSAEKGVLLLGARSSADIILTEEYENAGYEVRLATQDGSLGRRGLVTELLDGALADAKKTPVLYACGPTPMLMALGKIAVEKNVKCYLSLDQHMCCGIGACFACVVKVKDPSSPDGWRYSRSCKEGPVYTADEVYYEA